MTIVDFHSHVLPAVDDGSSSVAQSIEMLKMEGEQGITHVIATPHFYPQHDAPENFLARRKEAESLLRAEMQRHEGLPQVTVGAEIYYFRGISDSDFLRDLTIGNTNCVLIEMPGTKWTESMYTDLADIYHKQGLIPVIAHIDRYVSLFSARQIALELAQLPVYVQANADSFVEFPMSQCMLWMLRNGMIHLLGSDCHNTGSRAPNLSAAITRIEKKLGNDAIMHICTCQQEILSR